MSLHQPRASSTSRRVHPVGTTAAGTAKSRTTASPGPKIATASSASATSESIRPHSVSGARSRTTRGARREAAGHAVARRALAPNRQPRCDPSRSPAWCEGAAPWCRPATAAAARPSASASPRDSRTPAPRRASGPRGRALRALVPRTPRRLATPQTRSARTHPPRPVGRGRLNRRERVGGGAEVELPHQPDGPVVTLDQFRCDDVRQGLRRGTARRNAREREQGHEGPRQGTGPGA